MVEYAHPIDDALGAELQAAEPAHRRWLTFAGRCPGCTGDPRNAYRPVAPGHTAECHAQYKRCAICGAAGMECLHGRVRPADALTRESVRAAAWERWAGDYSFLGAPMWCAYDSEYNYLGDYRRGLPPPSIVT